MISSVSRTLAILQFLAAQAAGVTLTEIVEATHVDKSMASRILATLESEEYVVRSRAGEYFIGLKFVSMALQQLEATGLLGLCPPILQKIADETGELCQLAIVDGNTLHYVAKADGKDRIRVQPRLGTRAVLHATAVGKVWLASLPEEAALKLALNEGLQSLTENTITTVGKLRTELARVRRAGYAMNHAETFAGLNGIAVPIFGSDQSTVVGAIVVVAPAFRMPDERARSFVPLLRKQAESLRGIKCLVGNQELIVIDREISMAG